MEGKVDLNIPKQQKGPIAKPLSEIAEFYQLHPTTIGAIVRKNMNLDYGSDFFCYVNSTGDSKAWYWAGL